MRTLCQEVYVLDGSLLNNINNQISTKTKGKTKLKEKENEPNHIGREGEREVGMGYTNLGLEFVLKGEETPPISFLIYIVIVNFPSQFWNRRILLIRLRLHQW